MPAIADVSNRSIDQLISLAGRRAFVTGGGRGLGKAIARRLAEAGADVVIGDVDEKLAVDAANELSSSYSSRVLSTFVDMAVSHTVSTAADFAVKEAGGIDIWVNNAGIFPSAEILDMPDTLWDQVFAVNSRGVFVGAREAARRMPERGGVIVNVVSTAGFKGVAPGLAAYVGSKHAVRGITKQTALEFAPRGIRVLGVAPTYCVTEGNQMAVSQGATRPKATDEIPAMLTSRLGRVGVPDDVARAVLFCASDMSIFMTGSTLLVDAGETI
jgi:NAD(P)-dependent dehydrogenase (short-subunit alcohol dehydrogenase family)